LLALAMDGFGRLGEDKLISKCSEEEKEKEKAFHCHLPVL
jgi:hypothetical protein